MESRYVLSWRLFIGVANTICDTHNIPRNQYMPSIQGSLMEKKLARRLYHYRSSINKPNGTHVLQEVNQLIVNAGYTKWLSNIGVRDGSPLATQYLLVQSCRNAGIHIDFRLTKQNRNQWIEHHFN